MNSAYNQTVKQLNALRQTIESYEFKSKTLDQVERM
jgi:hypothetical protein